MPTTNPFSPCQQLVRVFKEDKNLVDRLKNAPDPLAVIQEAVNIAEQASWTADKALYRVAVGVLGALSLTAAIGAIVLVALGKDTPEVLVALALQPSGHWLGCLLPRRRPSSRTLLLIAVEGPPHGRSNQIPFGLLRGWQRRARAEQE